MPFAGKGPGPRLPVDYTRRKPDKELDINWRTVFISVACSVIAASLIGLMVALSATHQSNIDSIARSHANCLLTRTGRIEGLKRQAYSQLFKDILLDPRFHVPTDLKETAAALPPLIELKPPACVSLK